MSVRQRKKTYHLSYFYLQDKLILNNLFNKFRASTTMLKENTRHKTLVGKRFNPGSDG